MYDDASWQIMNVSRDSELSIGLRLVRFVVFICANNIRTAQNNAMMEYVEWIFTESDELRMFLQWVINNNLYVVVERIGALKTDATDIFASQALICAVDMQETRLVESLLKARPILDAKRHMLDTITGQHEYRTALKLAIHIRNTKIIYVLMAAVFNSNLNEDTSCSPEAIFERGHTSSCMDFQVWFRVGP